jgi:hypothetical protein
MNVPIEALTRSLCNGKAEFNLIHFKDLKLPPNAPAHFHVTISLGDDQYLLLCIITSQMQKLERIYRFRNQQGAIDSMVPLSSDDFPTLSIGCVVNCNDTELLTRDELARRIDPSISLDFISFNQSFSDVLKNSIINAIDNSPIVKPNIQKILRQLRSGLATCS